MTCVMRTLTSLILYIVSGIALACYALASVAPYVSPEKIELPAYFGLAYPAIWLAVVCLTIIGIVTRHWKLTAVLATAVVVSFGEWRKTVVVHSAAEKPTAGKELRILTYNVGIFNANRDLDRFVAFVEECDADVVCLQEFGFYRKTTDQSTILDRFDEIYPYRHLWYKNQSRRIYSGLATFSRHPIVKKEKIQYKSDHNVSIFSDIVVGTDTIRVINNHLESNRLSRSDRNLTALIDDGTTRDEIVDHSRRLTAKLGSAMKIRAAQAEAIRYTTSRSPHKVIVTGDFNDVPQSYTYRIVSSGLTDAYATAGRWGYYWTFNDLPMLFPIDHILTSPSITASDAKIHHIRLSDHYPMTATLHLK